MTQKATIPTAKTIANYIQHHSPAESKCVDADFMTIGNIGILAWIVDIPAQQSKNQGFYQALYTTYDKGKFGQVEETIPCQYYNESGKRTVTTTGFIPESEQSQKDILSVSKMADEDRIKVSLVCHGKAHAQSMIRIEKDLVRS